MLFAGLTIERNELGAVAYCAFDMPVSNDFCGVKAADLLNDVSDVLVLLVPALGAKDALIANEQLLRRVTRHLLQRDIDSAPAHQCVFVVVDRGSNTDSNLRNNDSPSMSVQDTIRTYVDTLLTDVAKTMSLSQADVARVAARIAVTTHDSRGLADESIFSHLQTPQSSPPRPDITTRLRTLPHKWKRIPKQPTLELSSVSICSVPSSPPRLSCEHA